MPVRLALDDVKMLLAKDQGRILMGGRQRAGAKANSQNVGIFGLTTAKSGPVSGMAVRWLRVDAISPWGPGEGTLGAPGPAPLVGL